MRRTGLVILIVGLGWGCAAPEPAPADTFYRLPPVTNVTAGEPFTGGVLYVAELQAEGIQSERAILYSPAPDAVVLDQYHYHYWSTGPGRLVRDHLVDYLLQTQAADKIVIDSATPSDLNIKGRVQQLLHIRGDERSSVQVVLQLQLVRAGQRTPLVMNTYSEQLPVDGGSMETVVRTIAQALERTYERFLDDARRAVAR